MSLSKKIYPLLSTGSNKEDLSRMQKVKSMTLRIILYKHTLSDGLTQIPFFFSITHLKIKIIYLLKLHSL